MSTVLAERIVSFAGLYLAIGGLFALWFVTFGARRIDPSAKGMPLQARLMIFPGVVGLWPIMLLKTFIQKAPPVS
jgi:hypothetical protein